MLLRSVVLATLIASMGLLAPPASARTGSEGTGSETGLPLPRFVSLKASRANMRRGPSMDQRIDWVLVRRGMPLKVIAEYGHWRQVEDQDGDQGWLYYTMIDGRRTGVISGDEKVELLERPEVEAERIAYARPGVIVALPACRVDWCQVEVEGIEGWVARTHIWGVYPGEEFE